MSWTIEQRGRVAVVVMTTNAVNTQGSAFVADLHEALDRLDRDYVKSPVVLTGTGTCFSAGLDLEELFPLGAGNHAGLSTWLAELRAANLRLFTYPRPTVAAVNGHALAGGLLTAAFCDYRICADADAQIGLPEVRFGAPMPLAYVRMLAYAWGDPATTRANLFGEVVDGQQALARGLVHEVAPAGQLIDRAVAVAALVPTESLEQFAFTKRACQAPVLRDIADLSDRLDVEVPAWFGTEQAQAAHRRHWERIKGTPAFW